MKRLILALALPTALAAQQIPPPAAFQNAFTTTSDVQVIFARQTSAKPVTGRPLSANEERHSLQILGDGTRIESKTVDKLYRDDQGRTRTEREDGTVIIDDPVAGQHAEISAKGKLVRTTRRGTLLSDVASPSADKLKLKAELDAQVKTATVAEGSYTFTTSLASAPKPAISLTDARKEEARKEQILGVQSVNGVLADATRAVTTIPAGQIGNDRPIEVVSERWYSTDLQMLIKSVNKDPRYGETTYELTNIRQGAPDASLFKIPSSSHQ